MQNSRRAGSSLAWIIVGGSAFVAALGFVSSDLLYGQQPPMWGDARGYSNVARELDLFVRKKAFSPYSAQRVLPSAIIWGSHVALGLTPTHSTVLFGFRLLNGLMALAVGLLWIRICRLMHLSSQALVLGAMALLLNFAILKHRTYDPILTDTTAYAIGTAMLCAYLERQFVALWLLTIAGAFTWPTLLIQGALLMMFTPPASDLASDRRWTWAVGFVAAAGYCFAVVYVLATGSRLTMPVQLAAVPLAVVLSAIQVALTIAMLTPSASAMRSYLNLMTLSRILLFLSAAVTVKSIQLSMASDAAVGYPLSTYLKVTVLSSVMYPATQLVAHAVYFGPLVLIVVLRWRGIATQARQWLGIAVCLVFACLNALNAESRGVINFYAMFVFVTVVFLESVRLGRGFLICFGAVSLLASKVWLTIGPITYTPGTPVVELFERNQRFFMNNGPAMTASSYLFQGGLAALVSIWLWLALRRARCAVQLRSR